LIKLFLKVYYFDKTFLKSLNIIMAIPQEIAINAAVGIAGDILQSPAGQRLIDKYGEVAGDVAKEYMRVMGVTADVAIAKVAAMDADTINRLSTQTGEGFKNLAGSVLQTTEKTADTGFSILGKATDAVTGVFNFGANTIGLVLDTTGTAANRLTSGKIGVDVREKNRQLVESLVEEMKKDPKYKDYTYEKMYEEAATIVKIRKKIGACDGSSFGFSGLQFAKTVILILALIMCFIWVSDSSSLWLDDKVFAKKAAIGLGFVYLFMLFL